MPCAGIFRDLYMRLVNGGGRVSLSTHESESYMYDNRRAASHMRVISVPDCIGRLLLLLALAWAFVDWKQIEWADKRMKQAVRARPYARVACERLVASFNIYVHTYMVDWWTSERILLYGVCVSVHKAAFWTAVTHIGKCTTRYSVDGKKKEHENQAYTTEHAQRCIQVTQRTIHRTC